jgi:GT2 family glycosyltransferase
MFSMYPSVSVIILNYNGSKNLGKHLLSNCLHSVLQSNYDNFEVFFVDNGSTDDSVEFVKKTFPKDTKLRIVENAENYGFPKGNNLAAKQTCGDYIILLNNDTEVEQNWMRELVNVMENNPTIGEAQSKILSFDRIHIQTVGNLLDAGLNTYLIGHNEEDKGQYDKLCEITFACGAALIVRRSLIEKIGLFDPAYFFYHDDCDLGWRVMLAGFKVVSVPSSIVYHKGGGTSNSTVKRSQGTFFLFTSQLGLFIKNLESRNFLKFGIMMSVSMAMETQYLLLHGGDPKITLGLLQWILKTFKHNWRGRLAIRAKIRKVGDDEVFKNFLDPSIFVLSITKNFERIAIGSCVWKDFNKLVNQITNDYYKNHIYQQ